jgi:putative transposase
MLPQGRHPPKGIIEDDRTPTLIFLTVCTARRQCWLADPAVHEALIHVWHCATHWQVGPYMLMPDHLHLFAMPGGGSATFDRWIQYWKSMFTKRMCNRDWRWQSGGLHHRIRSWEGAEAKRQYMMMNPVRAGLVARPEDWRFRGEIFRNDEWW